MFEFLTAGALGAISGFIGTIVTSITNYKMQKLKNEHDATMAKLDMEAIKVEAEANIKVTKAQVEGAVEIGEIDAFKKSYSMLSNDLFDKSYMKFLMSKGWLAWTVVPITLGFALVDFLKHLARPVITYYLLGVATWLTILLYKLVGGSLMPIQDTFDLWKIVVMTIIYMTATCTSWWFGDRRTAKFLNRLSDGNTK